MNVLLVAFVVVIYAAFCAMRGNRYFSVLVGLSWVVAGAYSVHADRGLFRYFGVLFVVAGALLASQRVREIRRGVADDPFSRRRLSGPNWIGYVMVACGALLFLALAINAYESDHERFMFPYAVMGPWLVALGLNRIEKNKDAAGRD